MMEHADFPEDGCADYPHCVYVCVCVAGVGMLLKSEIMFNNLQ